MENIKPFIKLEHVNKVYSNNVQAVFDFNLDINKNEFVVLVGPSGCGKSTTLRMIAGLEEITNGHFYIDDKLSNFVPSKDRNIAMVFQSYALYPNMNVFQNMAFGLKIQGVPEDEIEKRVFDAATILDLGNYLDRLPKELSGGQMQRVALGRAIVRNAPIFLMDEPLSNLDAKLRVSMRSEIVIIHQKVGSTTVYVTHDQVEAMTMATKIVVMNKGFVQQIGTPEEVYTNPENSFVATFIGTPAMNLFYANFNNGKIILDNNQTLPLNDSGQKYYEYLKDTKEEMKKHFNNFDYNALTYYKRIESNRANLNIDNGKEINFVTKKSLFTKLKDHFDDKKIEKTLKEKNKRLMLINEQINNFSNLSLQTTLEELKEELNKINEEINAINVDVEKKVIPEKYNLETNILTIDNNLQNEHQVLIGIRPEKIKLRELKENESRDNKIIVKAEVVELLGAEYNIYFTFQGRTLISKHDNERKISVGSELVLDIKEKDLYFFDILTGKRIY